MVGQAVLGRLVGESTGLSMNHCTAGRWAALMRSAVVQAPANGAKVRRRPGAPPALGRAARAEVRTGELNEQTPLRVARRRARA